MILNASLENVDVFTVYNKPTVNESFLDVRFSAHGSPFYPSEKMNAIATSDIDDVCIFINNYRKNNYFPYIFVNAYKIKHIFNRYRFFFFSWSLCLVWRFIWSALTNVFWRRSTVKIPVEMSWSKIKSLCPYSRTKPASLEFPPWSTHSVAVTLWVRQEFVWMEVGFDLIIIILLYYMSYFKYFLLLTVNMLTILFFLQEPPLPNSVNVLLGSQVRTVNTLT